MKYIIISALTICFSSFFVTSCGEEEDSGCTNTTWYLDGDGDGLGSKTESKEACEQPDGYVANSDDESDLVTLHAAFAEFDQENTDIYVEGSNYVIETNGLPNHTTVYWGEGHELYVEATVAQGLTPSRIPNYDASASLTVSANPQMADNTTATRLGAIGISVSGAAIFNDSEGNGPLSSAIGSLDYAGAHIGPSEYHYHLEPKPISSDDDNLIGMMADGFFIYGRKCDSSGTYPTDLDASGGHMSTTQHTTELEYHYHIINEFYTGNYILLFGGEYQGTPNSIN